MTTENGAMRQTNVRTFHSRNDDRGGEKKKKRQHFGTIHHVYIHLRRRAWRFLLLSHTILWHLRTSTIPNPFKSSIVRDCSLGWITIDFLISGRNPLMLIAPLLSTLWNATIKFWTNKKTHATMHTVLHFCAGLSLCYRPIQIMPVSCGYMNKHWFHLADWRKTSAILFRTGKSIAIVG